MLPVERLRVTVTSRLPWRARSSTRQAAGQRTIVVTSRRPATRTIVARIVACEGANEPRPQSVAGAAPGPIRPTVATATPGAPWLGPTPSGHEYPSSVNG